MKLLSHIFANGQSKTMNILNLNNKCFGCSSHWWPQSRSEALTIEPTFAFPLLSSTPWRAGSFSCETHIFSEKLWRALTIGMEARKLSRKVGVGVTTGCIRICGTTWHPRLRGIILKCSVGKFVAHQGIGAGWECEDLLRNSSHASHCVLRSTVDGHFHPGTGSVSNGRPFSAALERVVPSRPWERGSISYLNTLLSVFRRR